MKTFLFKIHLLAALLMVVGCADLESPHPLGSPSTDEVVKRLEGIWQIDNDVVYVKHAAGGKLHIAGIEWKENGFKLDESVALVTTDQDVHYVNLADPDADAGQPKYTFARLAASDDASVVLFPVNGDAFAKAVASGELAGEVSKDEFSSTVKLKASKEELDEFVQPEKATEQFQLDVPLVLKRIGSLGK